jgi:hypothetical protein
LILHTLHEYNRLNYFSSYVADSVWPTSRLRLVDCISFPEWGTNIYTTACRTTVVAKGACYSTGARDAPSLCENTMTTSYL